MLYEESKGSKSVDFEIIGREITSLNWVSALIKGERFEEIISCASFKGIG